MPGVNGARVSPAKVACVCRGLGLRLYSRRFFPTVSVRKCLVSDQERLGSVTCPGDATSGQGAECADRRERTQATQVHTYVSFAEGHVYNAADYDEGVKRVPGVTKVPLDRAGRGRCL